MRRIEDDFLLGTKNIVRYEHDGKWIDVDARFVRRHGLDAVREFFGLDKDDGEPVPVWQRDRRVGTLPADFDPLFPSIGKSKDWGMVMFDVRPGDFVRSDRGWEAAWNIGPGDFESIQGFRPERKPND